MGNPGLGNGPLLEVVVQNVAETVTHPVLSSPGPNYTVLSMIFGKDIHCEPNNTILIYLSSKDNLITELSSTPSFISIAQFTCLKTMHY